MEQRKTSGLELLPMSNSECTSKFLLLAIHCGKQTVLGKKKKWVDLLFQVFFFPSVLRVSLMNPPLLD